MTHRCLVCTGALAATAAVAAAADQAGAAVRHVGAAQGLPQGLWWHAPASLAVQPEEQPIAIALTGIIKWVLDVLVAVFQTAAAL